MKGMRAAPTAPVSPSRNHSLHPDGRRPGCGGGHDREYHGDRVTIPLTEELARKGLGTAADRKLLRSGELSTVWQQQAQRFLIVDIDPASSFACQEQRANTVLLTTTEASVGCGVDRRFNSESPDPRTSR